MSALAATAAAGPAPRRGARLVRVGLLAGAAVTAMEMLPMPVAMPLAERLDVVRYVFVQWALAAIGLAFVATWAAEHLRVAWLPLLLGGYALLVALEATGVRVAADRWHVSLGGSSFTGHSAMLPTFYYNVWMTLFFGGYFLVATILATRVERLRAARTAAAIARNRARSQLAQARLDDLHSHVDPGFLLRVMTEVEVRYLRHPEEADRLLGRLVSFLRHAMPGVRGQRVMLADELALAEAYAALWHDLDPGRARVTVGEATPVAAVPFPSFWLLPLLDRFGDAAPRGARATLTAQRCGDGLRVTLAGDATMRGPWLPPALERRTRAALVPVLGERWTLTLAPDAPAGTPVLVLDVPTAAAAMPHAIDPSLRQPQEAT